MCGEQLLQQHIELFQKSVCKNSFLVMTKAKSEKNKGAKIMCTQDKTR